MKIVVEKALARGVSLAGKGNFLSGATFFRAQQHTVIKCHNTQASYEKLAWFLLYSS